MTVAITWIDADGAPFPLDVDESRLVLPGYTGHRAPPVILSEEQGPDRDGAVLRQVRTGVRELSIPVVLWGTDSEFLDDRMATLGLALDPTRGPGRIRVERDGGTFRELECIYAGGLEGTDNDPGHDSVVLTFRAHNPYWLDIVDNAVTITRAPAGSFFPFFPLQLTASELFANAVVDNSGDIESWPVWTIHGPGFEPLIRNLDSGALTQLAGITLVMGDVLIIDTRPGIKSVRLNGGSAFGDLSVGSTLWPLARGEQSVRIELSGASDDTSVVLTWRQLYRGA